MRRFLPVALAALVASTAAHAAPWSRNRSSDTESRVDAPLVQEAGRYAVFQDDVAQLESSPFGSLDDIDEALDTIVSHDPDTFARAWLAYAALVAAQEPAFVDGVRAVADYYGRDNVIAGLRNDPTYAGQLEGAEDARQAVLATVAGDVARLREISEQIKQQAYSLQSLDWAKTRSGDNSARLARLETIEGAVRAPGAETLASLGGPGAIGSDRAERSEEARANFWRAFSLGPTTAHASTGASPRIAENPRYRSVLDQVVTLAALEALDAANADDAAMVSPMLEQPDTQMCLRMARMHFNQCIAASHFRYEDPFCIAEHGVRDIGGCMSKIASQ